MSINDAFDQFQGIVNASPAAVTEARSRRDLFKQAFSGESDVREVVASGSLARGTHKDPINDVDVVLIFDEAMHPDWAKPGESASDALSYAGERINDLLGATNGTIAQAVRLASPRNHAVKCFLDDPEDPGAFTVDAMPAFRRDGLLLVPERHSKCWVETDPEYLIDEVARRHEQWNKYAGTVRMLKWWAADQDIKIKSLVMEVLALDHLPLGVNRRAAIKEFFVKAAYFVESGFEVTDPAGHCGPIQSDLDYGEFADRLATARDAAAQAMEAQANNDTSGAIRWWGQVFGDDFPPPPSDGGGTPGVVPPPPGPRPVKDTPQG